jgi:Ca2+-binding RTX toxin-like protein
MIVLDSGPASDRDELDLSTAGPVQPPPATVIAGDMGAVWNGTQIAAYQGIEHLQVFGGQEDDTFNASAATIPVTLVGNFGNDTLIGGASDDFLAGAGGNDTLDGGPGSDTYFLPVVLPTDPTPVTTSVVSDSGSMGVDAARDRLPPARRPPPPHPTTPATNKRQGRTLHPHHAQRLGLRCHLPLKHRTRRRP